MLNSIGQKFRSVSGARAFSNMQVRGRVIDTGERTLSIDEIASLSLGVDEKLPMRASLFVLAVCASFGAIYYPLLWIAVALLVISIIAIRPMPKLVIGTSDGCRTVFESRDRAQLEEARVFLMGKINRHDMESAEVFDFSPASAIESSYEEGDLIDDDVGYAAGAYNNAQRPNANAQAEMTSRQTPLANDMARSAAQYAPNVNPSVQAAAQSTSRVSASGHIDYTIYLHQVTDLTRFYAKTPETKHIESRLSELELLMRSGTQSEPSRARVRQLTDELSTIMQVYPTMVQLFHGIATLADGRRAS